MIMNTQKNEESQPIMQVVSAPSKRIIWVHGTKGGVGKSLMSSIVVDYLLEQGETPAIVECDGSVPDVHGRFGDEVPCVISALNDVESVHTMLETLEDVSKASVSTIVVNLTANTELLDSIAIDIKDVCEALGYESRTLFMLSESAHSADLAASSMKDGLVAISSRAVAIVNMHFGKSQGDFNWFASPARKQWLDSGRAEVAFDEIETRVKNNELFESGAFSPMCSKKGFKVVDRVLLRKWLNKSHAIVESLLK